MTHHTSHSLRSYSQISFFNQCNLSLVTLVSLCSYTEKIYILCLLWYFSCKHWNLSQHPCLHCTYNLHMLFYHTHSLSPLQQYQWPGSELVYLQVSLTSSPSSDVHKLPSSTTQLFHVKCWSVWGIEFKSCRVSCQLTQLISSLINITSTR